MAYITISSPNGLNNGQSGYAIVDLITQDNNIRIDFETISFTFYPDIPQNGVVTKWADGPNEGQLLSNGDLGPEEFYGNWTLHFDNGCSTEATQIGNENSIAICGDITFTITMGNNLAPTVDEYPLSIPNVNYGFEGQPVVNYIDMGDSTFQIAPGQTGIVFDLETTTYDINFIVPTQSGYANASGIITCPVTFTNILDYIDCSFISGLGLTLSGDQGAPYTSGTLSGSSSLPDGWSWTANGDFGDEEESGVMITFTWDSDYYTIDGGRVANSIDCFIPVNTTALPFVCPANITIPGGIVENLGQPILTDSITLTNSDGTTYEAGTVTNIEPSNYTVGSQVTYTLSIEIADGYAGAGTVNTTCTTEMTICATDDILFEIKYPAQP